MNVIHKPIHAMLPETTPEEAGLSPQGLAKLTAVMRREVETKHVPGVSMLISRGGKIAFRENVGALRPGGPAMRSDGIFRIYSMTKPIVSVAIMTLVEDGLLWLSDPVAKFIPEMSNPQVGVEKNGKLELVPAERPITIQDLLRHTSGLTYGFLGTSVVQRLYAEAPLRSQDITSAGHVAALAKLPLLDQPGTHWHYSHSTDVLGRVVEIISGETLGAFLKERILGPLGMVDTGFHAPADKHERLAEPFPVDPDTGAAAASSRRSKIMPASCTCSITAAPSTGCAFSGARRSPSWPPIISGRMWRSAPNSCLPGMASVSASRSDARTAWPRRRGRWVSSSGAASPARPSGSRRRKSLWP
jgi:CubicO group peptidase (beta-lactamase class C family)